MKNKYFIKLLIISIIIITTFIFTPINTLAIEDDYIEYIDNYNINIKVNENNTFDIIEEIDMVFNRYKYGIYRSIPIINKIERVDGTTSYNRGSITNLKVNNNYSLKPYLGFYDIKIGSSNISLIGKQKYIISYTYNIGKDPLKGRDELYLNITGNEWQFPIKKVNFKITMPKEFDSRNMGIYAGLKGTSITDNVIYQVEDKLITGFYNRTLQPNEGITIRLELPENYFKNEKLSLNPLIYLLFVIPTVTVLLTYFLFKYSKKDNDFIETVEFYPPNNLNSLEVGYIYKGEIDNEDIISLLVYLASKGYLKIEETNKYIVNNIELSRNNQNKNKKIKELQEKIRLEQLKDANSPKIKVYYNLLEVYNNIDQGITYDIDELSKNIDKKIVVTKLKDYDGNNEYEKIFFEGLFHPKVNKNEKTIEEIKDMFYFTINRIKHKIKRKNKIFKPGIKFLLRLINLLSFFSIYITLFFPLLDFSVDMVFFMFVFIGFIYIVSLAIKKEFEIITFFDIVCYIIMIITYVNMAKNFLNLNIIFINKLYIVAIIYNIITIYFTYKYYVNISIRNPKTEEIYVKIKSFRNFLEMVEKDKLEMLVMENPNYFYDILPYTYVLGLSDKWINKFEDIISNPPDWYKSDNFDFKRFSSNLTNINKEVSKSENPFFSGGGSSSSSSSGGSSSSSGGGFSGGGSGGGGGRSW